MTIAKILFMDIDGPMIPSRAYKLPNQTKLVSVFDPCATAMVNELLKLSGARIVISSTWREHGVKDCSELLETNGINPDLLHPDWKTPCKLTSTRTQEIDLWLQEHPEITHYVAIDDEQLNANMLPGFVQCDMDEGFSFRNFLESKVLFGVATDEEVEKIYWLKRKEIWRTQRKNDERAYLTYKAADEIFPIDYGLKTTLI